MQRNTSINTASFLICAPLSLRKRISTQVVIGYRAGARLLRARQKDYAGIGALPSIRARAVAMLAVDYMKGLCSRRNLLGIKPEI